MQLIAHLNFNGNCEEAFRFYAETLGGEIAFMMKMGESPMADKMPAEMQDKIMHATLKAPHGGVLMGADHPEGKKVTPTGFCVSVQVEDKAEGQRIFARLAEGGRMQMAFQETFWSPGFGMCIDRFEIPWMVNCAPAA